MYRLVRGDYTYYFYHEEHVRKATERDGGSHNTLMMYAVVTFHKEEGMIKCREDYEVIVKKWLDFRTIADRSDHVTEQVAREACRRDRIYELAEYYRESTDDIAALVSILSRSMVDEEFEEWYNNLMGE